MVDERWKKSLSTSVAHGEDETLGSNDDSEDIVVAVIVDGITMAGFTQEFLFVPSVVVVVVVAVAVESMHLCFLCFIILFVNLAINFEEELSSCCCFGCCCN